MESGEYTSTFQTIDGCDSIVNLSLDVSENYNMEDTIVSCGFYLWPQNGISYSSSGLYLDPLQTVNGCDSIYSLHLNILHVYQFDETIESLDSFIWAVNDENYTQSGTYEANFTTVEGCDSTYTLNLTINIPKNIFVPEVFSPNADGINDRFTIFGNEPLERIESLTIYDRWGNLLANYTNFPPNDMNYGWDGKAGEKELNPGVYIYNAQVRFKDGSTSLLKGAVTKTK
ncbi:MAG: gliding motility-associated C-terminal domain-containing protein [Saprospiraceae bacterium]|nr:gliding motility-associated C-terminal domain-containing protein [Saprospiraceae bacterium]